MIGLPGGLQPRHSVGYGFTVACEIAALDRRRAPGCGPRSTPPPRTWRQDARRRSSPAPARSPSSSRGTVPLIYGCELTVPVAYRWKCQINENAKQHAFEHQLPELDHNEIVGWSADGARRSPSRPSSSTTPTSTRASASAPT